MKKCTALFSSIVAFSTIHGIVTSPTTIFTEIDKGLTLDVLKIDGYCLINKTSSYLN